MENITTFLNAHKSDVSAAYELMDGRSSSAANLEA